MALPRMIPAIPRPVPSPAMHMPQCAPMNVPAARMRRPTVEAFATSRVKQMRTTTTWRCCRRTRWWRARRRGSRP
uniref:Uncharacterized protein n=1 Tax=Triticum urartu TaxID=4572 RepID=A0A8R7PHG0_TRIUA